MHLYSEFFICLNIGIDKASIWLVYIPFFTVILTYSAGLKGKLFWIVPTWLVAVGLMVVFLKEHFYEDTTSNSILHCPKLYTITLRFLSNVFADSRAFKKDFLKADLVLKNMNKTDDYYETIKKSSGLNIAYIC